MREAGAGCADLAFQKNAWISGSARCADQAMADTNHYVNRVQASAMRVKRPSDGTCESSTTKTRYGPGGVIVPLEGTLTLSVTPSLVRVRPVTSARTYR